VTPSDLPGEELAALRSRVAALESELSAMLREAAQRRSREPALEHDDSKTSALLDALLDPTVAIDAFGTIQAASRSVEKAFGHAPRELVGRNVNVLMPEPYRSAHDGYLERYRRTGVTNILGRTRPFEVVCRDGSRIVCDLSVARAELPGGLGPLFIGSFRDVTERRRAEEAVRDSERRFRALFDRAFEFIGLLRPDGAVVEVNATALAAGGLSRDDVVGLPFWETRWWSHSAPMQERVRDAVGRASKGELARLEISQRGRGDTVLDIDLSVKPIVDDAGATVLLIAEGRDITELKAAQRAETAVLRALATIGESAAVLAHEIKNPITAVNLALRAVAEKLGEDHRAVLEDLVARMRHLEQLMRGTLSFSRPLDLRRTECDAKTLLENAVTRLRGHIEKSGAQVRVDASDDLPFRADPNLLDEVVSNLITNAVEAKGTAHVRVSAAPRGDGGVELAVEDDGPGIPPERREAVFKPFVTSKPGGTGLGLAICRKIVEEHGGTLRVSASALGGARFVVVLPAER